MSMRFQEHRRTEAPATHTRRGADNGVTQTRFVCPALFPVRGGFDIGVSR